MLTADLVRARRKSGELVVTALSGKTRARAMELADELLGVTRAHVGRSREELAEATRAIDVAARERKLFDGLTKLVADASHYESDVALDPAAVRARVFGAAAERRRTLAHFDRAEVLGVVATDLETTTETVEAALYADLKSAQVLKRVDPLDPAGLIERYDHAQIQAVLLKAVRVVADVTCESPAAYRRLFAKLKFRRLLYEVERREEGYRLTIDGPFSLFSSSTKYGMALALLLPALLDCGQVSLRADLRWGRQRQPLTFRLEHQGSGRDDSDVPLPDEAEALQVAFEKSKSWRATRSNEIVSLPGVGVCVPDLRFEHTSGDVILFELLGFWSRDAVWKRRALLGPGSSSKVLFAASARLRVSEEVMDDTDNAGLYVFKGSMSRRAVEDRLERLRSAGG